METFFNAAFGHHRFHGVLGSASIHMGGGLLNGFRGAIGIGKQQIRMPMSAPEFAQTL